MLQSMHINPHRVFGTPLDELIEREKNDALDVDVPLVVSQCVRRLKSHCAWLVARLQLSKPSASVLTGIEQVLTKRVCSALAACRRRCFRCR